MKFQTILSIGIIVELCLVPLLDAKRSFGITRSRNKNKGPSVRRNGHGQEYDDGPLPAVHPKPATPELRNTPANKPMGPPPAYPGAHNNPAPAYNAPPAYSPSYGNPPSYSSNYNQPKPGMYNAPGSYGANHGTFGNPTHNSYAGYGGGMPMGGAMPIGGMSPMGGMGGMGMMGGGYGRSGGSGIMTNLFAGLAGYQLARAFSGGGHHGYHNRDREVIIINNPPPGTPVDPSQVDPAPPRIDQYPLNPPPESQINLSQPTEIPQVPVGPANNEYNYYGIPQYGVPLYGYSMPSQTTDYYSSAIITMPQDIQPPPALQPTSEK